MFVHADATIDWQLLSDRAVKVQDVGSSLTEAWQRAELLGLIDQPPMRILDFGAGGGCFLFVCRYLGHDAVGLDLPNTRDHHMIVRACLNIEVVRHRIGPFRPLPQIGDRKFDLLTAFRIQFDHKGGPKRWTNPEWSFFLDDIRGNHIAGGGALALKARIDRDRAALFSERGGRRISEKQKLFLFKPLR